MKAYTCRHRRSGCCLSTNSLRTSGLFFRVPRRPATFQQIILSPFAEGGPLVPMGSLSKILPSFSWRRIFTGESTSDFTGEFLLDIREVLYLVFNFGRSVDFALIVNERDKYTVALRQNNVLVRNLDCRTTANDEIFFSISLIIQQLHSRRR